MLRSTNRISFAMLACGLMLMGPAEAAETKARPTRHRFAKPAASFYTTEVAALELHQDPVRTALLGSNSGYTSVMERKVRELCKLIGREGLPLLTGGGNGLPAIGATVAHAEGAYTIGVSPRETLKDHERTRPVDPFHVVYLTASGSRMGLIEREATLTQLANIGFVAAGNLGTLGELIGLYHRPGVIALLKEGHGVSANATKRILPHLGPLPSGVVVVEDSKPDLLFAKALEALAETPGAIAFPRQLVHPVGKGSLLTSAERRKTVVSLLVHENGMDEGGIRQLGVLLNALKRNKDLVNVMPKRDGELAAVMPETLRDAGAAVVQIDAKGAFKKEQTGEVRGAGMGTTGSGEFAAARAVVEDADAVIVAGGDAKTAAPLIYAMHNKGLKVIGVLKSGGLSSGLEHDILDIAKKNPSGARIIYDTDGARLYEKVEEALKGTSFPLSKRRGGGRIIVPEEYQYDPDDIYYH